MEEAEGAEEGIADVKFILSLLPSPSLVELVDVPSPFVPLVVLPTATVIRSGMVGVDVLVGDKLGDGAELPISLLSVDPPSSLSSVGFAPTMK